MVWNGNKKIISLLLGSTLLSTIFNGVMLVLLRCCLDEIMTIKRELRVKKQ